MFIKRIQLGMIHMAVAMTLLPINSTLNRVAINEMHISAALFAILASMPYLFSPLQVAIGSYSDQHPIFGLRRTPYIALGLLLCVAGVVVSPQVVFLMVNQPILGIFVAALAFGAWGMGYNLSSVSYLSLASDLSGKDGRGKTIAIMWFMMIIGIISTSIVLKRLLEGYNPDILQKAFIIIGIAACIISILGLIGLEPRSNKHGSSAENYSLKTMLAVILKSPQVTLFFWYLILLLVALLGQDIVLEPFAAQAFNMTVDQTARLTAISGVPTLLTILLAGALERRVQRKLVAQIGNLSALIGFLLIIASGFVRSSSVFYLGLVVFGAGTGLSTVANLALMFDLTLPGYMGLFIGAWGVSNAFSRLAGNLMAGIVHDSVTVFAPDPLTGYMMVFAIEAALLAIAIVMLVKIDVNAFQNQVEVPPVLERAALAE